jgi:uncharacterized membrane protein
MKYEFMYYIIPKYEMLFIPDISIRYRYSYLDTENKGGHPPKFRNHRSSVLSFYHHQFVSCRIPGVFCLNKIPLTDKIFSAIFEHDYPADLKFIILLLIVDIGITVLSYNFFPSIALLCAIPLLFFIPGYCFISIIFPRGGDLELLGRAGFSLGFSLAVSAFTGFLLSLSPWVYNLELLVVSIFLLSLILWIAALFRRVMVRNQDQYVVRFADISGGVREAFSSLGASRKDRFLIVVLLFVVLIVSGTTVFIVSQPRENEHFTEFFLLGENRTASGYPYEIVAGQKYPVYLGVTNHEARNVTYFIETWNLNTTYDDENETTYITAMDPGDQVLLTVGNNKTVTSPYSLSVNNIGYNRVGFLLFNATPPGDQVTGSDRINASYRNLYLRVSVRQGFYQESNTDVL